MTPMDRFRIAAVGSVAALFAVVSFCKDTSSSEASVQPSDTAASHQLRLSQDVFNSSQEDEGAALETAGRILERGRKVVITDQSSPNAGLFAPVIMQENRKVKQ